MELIDRSEIQYKMLEILPEADSLDWYERAKPDEVKELVDELYNIVLNANKIEAQSCVRIDAFLHTMTAEERAKVYTMPIFNSKCGNCGAMCFDDDAYCAECGAYFEDDVNEG